MRSTFSYALIISMLAAACGDSSGPEKAGPPAGLTAVAATSLEGQAGQALATPLSAKVVDAQGRAVANARVNFTIAQGGGTLSAASDTTDAEGVASVIWTLGTQLGAARAEARVQGILVPAVFNVTIKAGPPTQMVRASNPVGSSAAGFEVADSVSVRVSDAFGNPVAGATVNFVVASGGGAVTPATATTNDQGQARTSWRLGTAGAQALRATAGTLQTDVTADAAACTETQINPGAVLTIGPTDPRCVVLSGTASRYLVTVVNAAPAVGATNAFRVRGLGGGTGTTSGDVAAATTTSMGLMSAAARAQLEEAREHVEAHDEIMRANERVLQQMVPQARAARASLRMNSMAVPVAPPNVGDTLNLRIPGNFSNLCSLQGASAIRARVVFVGQHGVMLEDIAAPLAGQADSLYRLVGQEFDTGMWTLLNTNFGNPLAMDPQTDNNERFYMVFSNVVNTMQGGGIAGFVSSSDFFPLNICPASNLAEVFYARVPTVAGPGTGSGTAEDWYRRTRTVMIHEVKHIVSFAERISRGIVTTSAFNDADRWLEESSAMLAEELWGRTVFNIQPKTNVNYRQSVYCEVRLNETSFPDCPRPYKPLNIFDHFILLYDYLSNPEGLSPIGAAGSGDFTFYGSGWSFLRWVIDNYATSESAFLTGMTREINLPGVQNIEARTGRTFADLVNDWTVAMVMDDYPGFTAANTKHQFLGWNSRDIFTGMNRDFNSQGFFTRPNPLIPRNAAFGKFAVDVGSVRGGSMAVFDLNGTQTQRQLIEFNGLAGTAFPADMRVNIIRVQ